MPVSGSSRSSPSAWNESPLARALRKVLLPALSALLLAACAGNPALEQSRSDFAAGDRVGALLRLEQALKKDPDNLELRSYYVRQRDQVVTERLGVAEKAH
ncbi:general secretion pathway protein GspD, partial [Aromatoleum petrolei]|nr:general secretion pathway protein GspD [Aromatoleum petrolei]